MSSVITPRKIKRYGWKRDLPDHRDRLFAPRLDPGQLPPSVDLSAQCPPVYDQGELGSCTANAIGGAIQFDQIKQAWPANWTPSRLFIYWNERVIEGDPDVDGGAQIRDGIKSIASLGACPESLWPYNPAEFAVQPPAGCFTTALLHKAIQYQSVAQVEQQIKAALAQGYPVVFGFSVYESFESEQVAQTGIVPMPESDEESIGGHAVLCVGYDDTKQMFKVRNSWGPGWGLGGYFEMPYAYLLNPNLASDFWIVENVQ